MAATKYTARKTKDAGRQRYSVIYRHPARIDPSSGKPGRRVRRGLGTSDGAEADQLVAELNKLLADEAYWSLTARPTAKVRFDPRVVSIFYDGMEPAEAGSSAAVRNSVIPLPAADDGYKQVLLLGTTGAGKTTVVRQLLGTDPGTERFPSTSTAKTTVADTEIIVTDDSTYRAVVTFAPRDEVIDHLTDCASKAALASLRGAPAAEVRRLMLDHENQRFRFSYVLGRSAEPAAGSNNDFDDLDDFEADPGTVVRFAAEPEDLEGIDIGLTATMVDESVAELGRLVRELQGTVNEELVSTEEDERIAKEILEEELDQLLRSDEGFNHVVDALLDEIEKRFDAVGIGKLVRNQQQWPQAWSWETEDRVQFLKAVNRFSSNYAPLFGQLLSPLVDGIRVAGHFRPEWWDGNSPKLVLIDGEGLGHTPKSAAVLPTNVAKAIDAVDGVLLVDNAAQPLQAAPATAIRSILTSGNIDKLVFCFTHFDEVRGDNLTTPTDRARHVLASAENLVSSFREEFHPRAERAVRRRLDGSRFFLANVDQRLDPADRSHHSTLSQLKKLLAALEQIGERPSLGPARPRYDKTNLVLAISDAIKSFHRRWNALLGITYEPDVDKEHWTRVKALNRRFAEGTADQYDTLRPSAELRELLKDEIYKTLESPLGWTGQPPSDDAEVSAIVDAFSNAIANRLFEPIRTRLSEEPQRIWQAAYSLHGTGSTFDRARRISSDILAREVPVPGATPSPDQNDFLHAIIDAIKAAAESERVELR
jgi:hypothetical protein